MRSLLCAMWSQVNVLHRTGIIIAILRKRLEVWFFITRWSSLGQQVQKSFLEVKTAHARYEKPRQLWKLGKMDDAQQRAESYLCNASYTLRLMGPFPFYLLFGKFIYSAPWATHQGLSNKKASLQSGWGGLWRFPGRILQQMQYWNLPDDRYLKNQQWELAVLSPGRAMAMLISNEMDAAERCRCRLSLLMFCKFNYFYQGTGNPGNDGNIRPEQDYQEVTCLVTRKYYKRWQGNQSY